MRTLLLLPTLAATGALVPPSPARRAALGRAAIASAAAVATTAISAPSPVRADETYPKRKNLSPAEMAAAVKKDIVDNQFLVTGQLTRDIYDESATFTDAIDTYTLDKWIKGTAALFVGPLSHVDLVGNIEANDKEIKFRFDEILAFNLPFVKPKVPLTGTLILTRSPETGLITKYLEIWDTGVTETLLNAKL